MFTNPHNQNLINDVMRVLSGATTEEPIRPIPQWITEAATLAAEEVIKSEKSGMVSLESRRDILRKGLSEAIANCDCQVSKETAVQFEEAVTKAMTTTEAPIENKQAEKLSEAGMPKPETAETATKPKPAKMAKPIKVVKKIGEEVELELREFLTHLTTEEVTVLRTIINENH